jgi:hypothetical protein
MDAYTAGDWATARQYFEQALELWPSDGPTKTLLAFMAQSNFVKPVEWDGYRELLEK